MENHREIDGTIKWQCWQCAKQFSENCGLDVLAHGIVEKRPDRSGDLWGFSKPNVPVLAHADNKTTTP